MSEHGLIWPSFVPELGYLFDHDAHYLLLTKSIKFAKNTSFYHMNQQKDKKLSSWKEISSYLGYSERTCRRLETKVGLPVYRLDKNSNSRVFAYADELDAWLHKGSNNAPSSHSNLLNKIGQRKGLFVFLLIALGLISCGLFLFFSSSSPQPADFDIDKSSLIILDGKNRVLWKYETKIEMLQVETIYRKHFQHKITGSGPEGARNLPYLIIRDLNGDKLNEVLFSPRAQDDYVSGKLICLDNKGTMLWDYEVGRELTFGTHPYSRDFMIRGMETLDFNRDGKMEIVVISNFMHGSPTQVILLSCSGKLMGEYWNYGQFSDFDFADLNGDGRTEVLLAGQNDEYDKPCLVVLNPENMQGASPADTFKCDEMVDGTELFYGLFPLTELELPRKTEIAIIRIDILENNSFSCDTSHLNFIYHFGFDLSLRDIRLSDAYRVKYAEVNNAKKLGIPLDENQIREALKKGFLVWNGKTWNSPVARSGISPAAKSKN